jgi:hypothetical protein
MAPKMRKRRSAGDRGSVKRSLTLKLSQVAFEALVGRGETGDERVAARLEAAVRFYLSDREEDRPAWPYPAFLRGSETQRDVELELSVDDDLWRSFAQEADEQGVSVQQLSEHAAFYLAAEMDAGRITQRILDDLEPAD